MHLLSLQCHEAGQNKNQQVYEQQNGKNTGTFRIGPDPIRCDIDSNHPAVSGLHIEIFFHSQQQSFYIRSLREPNPPQVDNKPLVKGEMPLNKGSIIYLGHQPIQVMAISINSIPATMIVPPSAKPGHYHHHKPSLPTQPTAVYGLECPKCHKISPPKNL
jgi:hypothetical protein